MAGAAVKLQSAAPDAQPIGVCPVHAEPWLFTNGPGSSARSVRVNGAGAVRDKAGAKMGDAEALRLHLPGDSVTVTVPVVEGIALADVDFTPTHPTPTDPPGKIALAGDVLDASGRTLATCKQPRWLSERSRSKLPSPRQGTFSRLPGSLPGRSSRHIGSAAGAALLWSDPRYRSARAISKVPRTGGGLCRISARCPWSAAHVDLDGASGCSRFWSPHRGALSRPPAGESADGIRGYAEVRGDFAETPPTRVQLSRALDIHGRS